MDLLVLTCVQSGGSVDMPAQRLIDAQLDVHPVPRTYRDTSHIG